MGKGKAQKGRKVKTVASKQGKRGADTAPANVFGSHDRKAGKASDVALTPAPPAAGQGVAGAKVVGFTNLGNTCFFNSVLQVNTNCCILMERLAHPLSVCELHFMQYVSCHTVFILLYVAAGVSC